MKAIWNGVVLAESDDIVVVDGNPYFPAASLDRRYVTFSNHRTSNPVNGEAKYYSLLVNGELKSDAVWYYPEPKEEAEQLKDRVAFGNGVTLER